jgi:hypothetical protein
MKIQLDHIQRLNLHALLGAQRGDLATVRTLWALQDKLALTQEEEKLIELQRELVNGQERVVWNPSLGLPPKEFAFTDAELARLKAALESWNRSDVRKDRPWLQPLLDNLG